jgi:hypothetical protein
MQYTERVVHDFVPQTCATSLLKVQQPPVEKNHFSKFTAVFCHNFLFQHFIKSGFHFIYHWVYYSEILLSAHTLRLYVLYGSQNRDYFPTQLELIDFHNRGRVCLLRGRSKS